MSISRSGGIVAGNEVPRKTYLAVRTYNNDFFSYRTVRDGTRQIVGILAPVDGATSSNCLQGQFLHETGKRLYPDANPGVHTLLVGVYDTTTRLRGFIDPNSLAFTIQNADRAYYIDDPGTNPNSNTNIIYPKDQAQPVYTQGDVLADGNCVIGTTFQLAGGKIPTSSSTFLVQVNGDPIEIDCSKGSYFVILLTSNIDFIVNAINMKPGQVVYVIYSNPNSNNLIITFGSNINTTESDQYLTISANTFGVQQFIGFESGLLPYLMEVSRNLVRSPI